MSRSYRKTPVFSFCGSGKSEKQDKKIWHGAMRASERDKLAAIPLYEGNTYYVVEEYIEDTMEEFHMMEYPLYGGTNHITTHVLDVSCVWVMSKDGKSYWSWKSILKWCTDWEANPYPKQKKISKERYFYKDFKAK